MLQCVTVELNATSSSYDEYEILPNFRASFDADHTVFEVLFHPVHSGNPALFFTLPSKRRLHIFSRHL